MSFPPLESFPEGYHPVAASPSLSGDPLEPHSEDLLRQIANSLPVMTWMCGTDGRATLFNERWLQFTGSALPRALLEGCDSAVHPEDVERRSAARQAAWPRREPFETEYRLLRADGEYRWMLDEVAPRFDAGGVFQGYVGVAIDITERRRDADELLWLSKAVEQSPAIVVITDLSGRIQYVNRKFTELTGYTLQEAKGQNPRFLKSGETSPEEYRKLWQTIQTGEWRGEFHNRKKNGELFWEAASICPVRDASGKPIHYIAVKEDITERKRMDAALQESEERFRIAVESAGIKVYDLNLKTGANDLSSSSQFLGGLTSFDSWSRAIHPDDRERVMAALERRKHTGKVFKEEYRLVGADGTVRSFLDYGAPQRDGHWVGALRDITASKEAEAGLARLAALVQCSSDAIVSLDSSGILQTWNSAAERLYGYSAEEVVGRSALDLSPPGRREDATRNLAAMLSGTPPPSYEAQHMRQDGSEFPVEITASPIRNAEGESTGTSAIIRDITAQKRAQEKLMESENRFRALVQSSNDFITLIDPAGIILYDSPGVSKVLGVSPEQRLGTEAVEWLNPDDQASIRQLHQDLLRTPGARVRSQVQLRHADGSWVWCDSWATNLIDEPGVRALVASFRDITELKGVETALRESEQRYRGLVEDASDIIFTIDLAGNLTSVNSIGERLTGYSRPELLAMSLRDLVAPEAMVSTRHAITAHLANETQSAVEVQPAKLYCSPAVTV